jgi:hypothetical protein
MTCGRHYKKFVSDFLHLARLQNKGSLTTNSLPYKNSIEIIQDLKEIHLPNNAVIFSADAESMYTNIINIDTDLALDTLKDFLTINSAHIPMNFPTSLFLRVMEIVMKNNIFSFQEIFWIQLSGTAMGTPVACSYATITYGHYKNMSILPTFTDNLLYYKRYIDDIFVVWAPPVTNKMETWTTFKNTLNQWGSLEWIVEEPLQSLNFLDLTLHISNSKILTKTYQKSMNLYLYIPSNSAHPPSCLIGPITGELRRYWLQNSNKNDFNKILTNFIQCLTERRHKLHDLIPIFHQAATILSQRNHLNHNPVRNTDSDTNDTLYLHWQYHPNGIQRTTLRQLYDMHLAPFLDYKDMVVAMSSPKNLKDLLTRATLEPEYPGNISNIVTRH